MQIFKKERQVVQLALQHREKTRASLETMIATVRAFAGGEHAELGDAYDQANRLETEADALLREIRELLYSGAYLPTIRGDLYRLMTAADKVTNRIESCLEFVSCQRPVAVQHYVREIDAMLAATAQCFDELAFAMDAFFESAGDVEELRRRSRNVSEIESAIDENESTLTRRIFESDISLGEKMHLAQLVSRIAGISDQMENAADELELLSLKSII